MAWGSSNDFPETAIEEIDELTVLHSGLKYKLQLLLGREFSGKGYRF